MPDKQTSATDLSSRVVELIDDIGTILHTEKDTPERGKLKAIIVTKVQQLAAGYPDLKKAVIFLLNSVKSSMDELDNGDKPIARVRGEVMRACSALQERVNQLVHEAPDLSDDGSYDGDARELLRKNERYENALRAGILSRGVYAGQAPIIPLSVFNREKLNRLGISNSLFSVGMPSTNRGDAAMNRGYTVLNHQRVVGISFDYIRTAFERDAEGVDPDIISKIKRLRSYDGLDALMTKAFDAKFEEAMHQFKLRYPNTEQVGNPCVWNKARWYWVMPKRELALLRSAALSETKFSLSRWDFAFTSRSSHIPHRS